MRFNCAHCGKQTDRPAGHVNRSRANGLRLFCGRKCSGLAKRHNKTAAQKKEEKRLYDLEYRAKNREMLKAKKHEYFKRTYDPVAAAVERKKRMPKHIEYCRRPEYRVKKQVYDRKRRAAEYGEFAEAFQLTIDLNRAIRERAPRHEVKYQNGGTNKAQRRKREAQTQERGRNSRRGGPGHPAAHGW